MCALAISAESRAKAPRPDFQYTCAATLMDVEHVREALDIYLGSAPIPKEIRHNFVLGFMEWATNLVQHALEKPHKIEVSFYLFTDKAELVIRDDGSPFLEFADQLANQPLRKEINDMGEEGGLGLYLLAHLFELCFYNPRSTTLELNELCLSYPFATPLGGDPFILQQQVVALVEDDEIMRTLTKMYLEQQYQVVDFADAESAWAYLREHAAHVSLILCDVTLPGMDGLQLRKKLLQEDVQSRIPFLFLTRHSQPEMEEKASELGIDGYLTKPVEPRQLLTTVRRSLLRAEQVRQSITHELDQRLTMTLEPQIPDHINGFSCALRTQEASAGGGDVAFCFEHQPEHLLFLGDVMGHGVTAKYFAHAYAGYLYGMLRAMTEQDGQAEHIMQQFDRCLSMDAFLQQSMMTLLIMGMPTAPDKPLRIVSAGHPPPVLVTEKQCRFIKAGGPMAGLSLEHPYEATELTLEPGQRLFLYTDGLFESTSNLHDQKRCRQQVFQILQDMRTEPLDLVADTIMQTQSDIFKSSPEEGLQDDVTIILLEHNPEGDSQ